MPKRSSTDINVLAAGIVNKATSKPVKKKKNPAAVELGRLGGLKGGVARAETLSSSRRSDIARLAAHARWRKKKSPKKKR